MRKNPIASLFASIVLSGCMYATATFKEDSFVNADIKKIEPGRTTKEEILKWFGPPLAIAKKGEEDKIIPLENVRVATFLELFATKHILTETDIIYYYRNVDIETKTGAVLLVISESKRSAATKLWILIDTRSGIVEDYVISEAK